MDETNYSTKEKVQYSIDFRKIAVILKEYFCNDNLSYKMCHYANVVLVKDISLETLFEEEKLSKEEYKLCKKAKEILKESRKRRK